jgi:RimJ/RimL family protein N-acetyltransferase
MSVVEPREIILRDGARVTLRSACEDDAGALIEHARLELASLSFGVVTELDELDSTPEKETEKIREHARNPGCLSLLACIDERIIGTLRFKNHPRRRMAHHGHFGVGVSEAWRSRGVGRALILALLDWAVASDTIEKVCLGVFAENTRARALYRSLGFFEEGRRLAEFRTAPGRYSDDIEMFRFVKPHLMHLNADLIQPYPTPGPLE